MSGRAGLHRCEKCLRPTPRKRLRATVRGAVCPRCFDRLPKRLKTNDRVGQDKEKDT